MHDETANSQPPAEGTSLSRRGFMYGTTAAAAGAMLLGRTPRGLSHRADHVVLPSGHVIHPVGSSGAFTWKQNVSAPPGSGSLSLTLTTIQKYSLLVATLVSEDGTPAGAFSTTTTGWHRASAVSTPNGSGRVEIWYYPGTPDSPGTGGTMGTTFPVTFNTNGSTATCRGAIAEFGTPQNLPTGSGMIAVLDAPGQNTGHNGGVNPTTLTMIPAAGNVGGALGIVAAGDFFTSKVAGSWTAPGTGWAPIHTLGGTVTAPWGSWYDLGLGAGVQPSGSTSPQFSLGGDNDWAVAFAAFRGVVFPGIYLDGGENINIVALDPTGQELILGGDVEGMWRSADFGDHWQLSQDGIWGAEWRCTAAVAWSQTAAAEVYACVGKKASANDGGFMVSTDGGVTWSMRAFAGTGPGQYSFLNFQANDAIDVRPTTEGADEDRSVGNLIAQATVGTTHYLYAATYNSGVAVSTDDGNTWGQAGLADGNYFLRALALDPNNSRGLYAGAWAFPISSPTHGGLYHTADATVPSPSWGAVALPGHPNSTVSDVKVLGGNVYVTFTQLGVYLYQPGPGTWFALATTDSSHGLWTGLDVYPGPPGSGEHVVVAVCGSASSKGSTNGTINPNYTNVVRVTVTAATGGIVTTDDLTGRATINSPTVPPDGQGWWHNADVNFENWIGEQFFHNPHVLVNPQNPSQIFVTGASGHFRTDNAGMPVNQIEWDVAVNGAPAIACLDIAIDPNQPDHYAVCGTDYAFIDVSGDNTGFSAATVVSGPVKAQDGSKLETHAASFDQRSNISAGGTTYKYVVYVGVHNKFGLGTENANGDVQWTSDQHVWHPTGLPAAMKAATPSLPDNAVIGVYSGTASSGSYVVAAVIGNGIWRSAIPSDLASWSWLQVDSVVGTAGTTVQHLPIVANAAGTILYCFDRDAATIYRAKNNAGKNWVPIWTMSASPWNQSVTDQRSGWLAVNPAVTSADELWVATSQSIWKLSGASSGTATSVGGFTPVDMGAGTGSFPAGCGGLAFTTTSGTLYAVSLNGQAQTSAQLLTPKSGGGWQSGDPGNSFGSYISWPGPARMTTLGSGATTQTLLVGSNPNLGIYGTVTA